MRITADSLNSGNHLSLATESTVNGPYPNSCCWLTSSSGRGWENARWRRRAEIRKKSTTGWLSRETLASYKVHWDGIRRTVRLVQRVLRQMVCKLGLQGSEDRGRMKLCPSRQGQDHPLISTDSCDPCWFRCFEIPGPSFLAHLEVTGLHILICTLQSCSVTLGRFSHIA